MASRFYGINFGQMKRTDVVEQGTTTGRNVDLQVVYDAANNSKIDVINALQALTEYVTKNPWPPV